jgi:hypothetical protein
MSYPTISVKLPDPFEIFIIPISLTGTFGKVLESTTQIYWVSQPILSNQTILLSGNVYSLTGSFAQISYVPNTIVTSPFDSTDLVLTWSDLTILQISSSSIKFTIPSYYSQGIFAYRILTNTNYSNTFYVNLPEIWFVQGNQGRNATSGGYIIFVGTCLAIIEGTNSQIPQIALVNGSNITIISANNWNSNIAIANYSQTFTIPLTVTLGNYTIYYHNGYGGNSGWKMITTFRSPITPSTTIGNSLYPVLTSQITIETSVSWPTNIVIMPAPVTVGSDDANMTIALASLAISGGGILSIPSGTYNFNNAILVPPKVVINGTGMLTTILNWLSVPIFNPTPPSTNPYPASIIAGTKINIQGYWGFSKFSISNLSITKTTSSLLNAITITQNHTNDFTYFRNIFINLPGGNTNTTQNTGISLTQTENIEISNCIITATNSIIITNCYYMRIIDNTFNYINVNVQNNSSCNVYCYNNIFNVTAYYVFDGTEYGIVISGAENSLASDLFFGSNICEGNLSGITNINLFLSTMETDNVVGAFFGSGVIANGTLLTFPSTINSTSIALGVVMIISGTGLGQWRYVLGGVAINSTQISITNAWDVLPDINSTISLVGMIGRIIFAGNSYLQDSGINTLYYATTDFIQANNITTTDGPIIWTGERIFSSVVPGWHYLVLNNHTEKSTRIITNPYAYQYASNSQVVFDYPSYTGAMLRYHVYRANIFDANVPSGGIVIDANLNITDVIIEQNIIPSIEFDAATNQTIRSTIIRQNIASTGSSLPIIYNPLSLSTMISSFP